MLIAHGPASVLINEFIQKDKIEKLSADKHFIVVSLGMLFGILPDFDFFYLIASSLPKFLHHELITHTPVFWLIAFFLLKGAYRLLYSRFNKKAKEVFSPEFTNILLNTFLISTLAHLVGDLFINHISLFYPFTDQGFSLFGKVFPESIFSGFESHPIFALELGIVVGFLLWLLKKFTNSKQAFVNTLSYSAGVAFLLYTAFNLFVYSQTYITPQVTYRNGSPVFDKDYDGIFDLNDADIGNTEEFNIVKADPSKIAKEASKLADLQRLTVSDDSFISKVLYRYGAFDSYRAVEYAFTSSGYPIYPVLDEFYKKNNAVESYKVKFAPDKQLYLFLKKNKMLRKLTLMTELEQGHIILFLNEEEELLNLGVTTSENQIVTVLGKEKLQAHPLSEITKYYKKQLSTVLMQK